MNKDCNNYRLFKLSVILGVLVQITAINFIGFATKVNAQSLILAKSPLMQKLPDKKKLIGIGVSDPGTTQASNNYIVPGSLETGQKDYEIYFVRWKFYHYKMSDGSVASKAVMIANCYLDEVAIFNIQSYDANGKPVSKLIQVNGNQVYQAEKGNSYKKANIYAKFLEYVCEGRGNW